MELGVKTFRKTEYVETASGNKVSRQTTLCGSQNIVLNGRTLLMNDCIFRGDLANIRMGRYCIVEKGTIIRPSTKKFAKGFVFIPVHIGDHVLIEEDVVLAAAVVGSYVHIGRGAVVGRRAMLKDACAVLPDTVIPPDTVVPPFAVMGGNPARVVGELPDCTQELMIDATKSYYSNFIAEGKQ